MACRRSQVRSLSGPPFNNLAQAGFFYGLQALDNAQWPGSQDKSVCSPKCNLAQAGLFYGLQALSNYIIKNPPVHYRGILVKQRILFNTVHPLNDVLLNAQE